MSEPIYQGYIPPEPKRCIRCHSINDNPLQMLCDECREADNPCDEDEREEDEIWIDEVYTRWIDNP
jgi:hypothetical protein